MPQKICLTCQTCQKMYVGQMGINFPKLQKHFSELFLTNFEKKSIKIQFSPQGQIMNHQSTDKKILYNFLYIHFFGISNTDPQGPRSIFAPQNMKSPIAPLPQSPGVVEPHPASKPHKT